MKRLSLLLALSGLLLWSAIAAEPSPAAPAASPAPAVASLPYVYKLRAAYVAETSPAEWVYVIEGVCFKSSEALRRAIPKLLKPAIIEIRTGGATMQGQPLTTEAEVSELAAYCKSQGVEFRQIPGK